MCCSPKSNIYRPDREVVIYGRKEERQQGQESQDR